jgi:hypothetical protein
MNPFISFSDTLISGSIFNPVFNQGPVPVPVPVPHLFDIATINIIVSNKNLIDENQKTPLIKKILRNVDLTRLQTTLRNSNQQNKNQNPSDKYYINQLGEHQCKLCEYFCKTKSAAIYHYNNKHLNIGKFRCPQCEYSSNYKTEVEAHLTIKHQMERRLAQISVITNDLHNIYAVKK